MDLPPSFTNTSTASMSLQGASELPPPPPPPPDMLEVLPVVLDPLDGGWFGKIGTSAVLLFGTFGNLMTIAVLRRFRASWSAMNVYLTALALSDTTMLCSTAFPMWARKVLDFDLYVTHVAVCKGLIWTMNSSAAASACVLVALTVQRALSVVWPHRVNVLCTRGKSVILIVVVAAVCCLMWAHALFGYDVVHVGNGTSARCTFGSESYQAFWVDYWVTTDLVVFCLIPLSFLLISNVVLGWKLAVSVKKANQRFSSSAKEEQKTDRQKKASSTTVTVIVVSTAYVLTTLPLMTYNILFHDLAAKDESSRRFHYFVYDLFLVFGLTNFAWNFYLYCLTGTKFRQEFLNILSDCCGGRQSASGSLNVGEGAHTASGGSPRAKKQFQMESNDDF